MSFKSKYNFKDRKAESTKVMKRHPDRIPIICEKTEKSNIPDIDKHKYLVPADLTVGQFIYVIRKRLELPSEKAIFLFIDGIIPSSSALIKNVYDNYKNEDGFLYVYYSGENVFGCNPFQKPF